MKSEDKGYKGGEDIKRRDEGKVRGGWGLDEQSCGGETELAVPL